MRKLNINEAMSLNGGWTRCRICNKNVNGNWWSKYKHCLGHASRCLPWESIMGLAFGIWL
ncbi:MAG: hypothetical protein IJC88_05270 [Oscillospiraceae bacterium]|nr:hypothetical protein [Oscillospiraceae bacterium]